MKMSNVPFSTITRTFEVLSLNKLNTLGSGKTAVVYSATTSGGHRRAVRIMKLDDFLSPADYEHIRKSLIGKHEYIVSLMHDRVPPLYGVHLIPSKRGNRILGLAQVMGWVDGPTLGSVVHKTEELVDLRNLLKKLWSNRISHGDLFRGNIIFSTRHKRWKIIDLDNIKMHKSAKLAQSRDMGLMDPMLRDILSL